MTFAARNFIHYIFLESEESVSVKIFQTVPSTRGRCVLGNQISLVLIRAAAKCRALDVQTLVENWTDVHFLDNTS